MTPVRRYGSISVSFSVIYQYNNYCRGTGGTCNAVIQFNSLTLTMDFFCVPLCMVVREIMLMMSLNYHRYLLQRAVR